MLIIFDDTGEIQFAFSDDTYIRDFFNRYKIFPFLNHGKNVLWLKGKKLPKKSVYYKIDMVNECLIKKSVDEIKKIKLAKKNIVKRTITYIK